MGLSASDTDLVLKSQTGNSQAFNQLIERHGSKLLHSAYYMTEDWDEAMDVVQDALIYAYRSLDQLRDPNRFLPWIQTILLRTYRGYIRREKRRHRLLDYYITTEGSDPSIALESGPLPDQDLCQKERISLIHRSLKSLTDRNRRVVELYYLEDWPIKRISAVLHLSIDTIKNRLRSARTQIREEMKVMTTVHPISKLKPQRIAQFQISGSFSGDASNPFGLNKNLLHQRILSACRKTPLTPSELADQICVDEVYVVDALVPLVDMEIIAEAEADRYIANCFFPTTEDDQVCLRRCAPYVERVILALKEQLPAIRKAVDYCSFATYGFGWIEMHWIVLCEWLPQPPVPGRPEELSGDAVSQYLGPLRPDGGFWHLSGRDSGSPLADTSGARSFRGYGELGRHYRIEWPGVGRLMKGKEFALVVSLAKGSKSQEEVLSDLPPERAKETLAECVDLGYINRVHGRYQLAFPVVYPEDEVKIAEVMQPVSDCLEKVRDEWREETVELAKELGFSWLWAHQPDSVRKGLEGVFGLHRRMRAEGLIQPPPASADPCWAMWAKVY